MDRSVVLAEQAANLKYEDIPQEVIERAKQLIIDQLGCQLGFAIKPWAVATYEYITKNHPPADNATIFHYGTPATVEDAAYANAAFGHGFEMDDMEMTITAHPAVCVIPPILAIGEDIGANGKQVLTAMISGYETFVRFGRAVYPMYHNCWQGTPIPGGFGAAAAAGHMLGFDTNLMREAFAITTTTVSGNDEHMHSGGSAVHNMPANSVQGALRACYLAQGGMTGPTEAFDGERSLLRGICEGEPYFEHLDIPFVGNWYTMNVGQKPYCCCGGTHSTIDNGRKIHAKGIKPEDIEHVEIIMQPHDYNVLHGIVHPTCLAEAQFSARFECALAIVKGDAGYHAFCDENVHDPKIHALIDKIDMTEVPYGAMAECMSPSKVIVTLKDGTVIEEYQEYASGMVQNPLTFEQTKEKFLDLTKGIISEERAEAIIDTVLHLEEVEDIHELTKLLVRDL